MLFSYWTFPYLLTKVSWYSKMFCYQWMWLLNLDSTFFVPSYIIYYNCLFCFLNFSLSARFQIFVLISRSSKNCLPWCLNHIRYFIRPQKSRFRWCMNIKNLYKHSLKCIHACGCLKCIHACGCLKCIQACG